jgi:hypothetical protein
MGAKDLLEGDILELTRRCTLDVYMLGIDHKGNNIVVIKDHLEPPGDGFGFPRSLNPVENTATEVANQEDRIMQVIDPTVDNPEIFGLPIRE